MTAKVNALAATTAALVLLVGRTPGADWRRGDLFIALKEPESCEFGGDEWVVQVRPETGQAWIVADPSDGICSIGGLRFTPDGSRLLLVNNGFNLPPVNEGWIQAFDEHGASEIILDSDDGLFFPYYGLAFDGIGDLYVVNAGESRVLRFPQAAAPATVFADSFDGIFGRGDLAFGPDGELYYTGEFADAVIRISPNGHSIVFDDFDEIDYGPTSLAVDFYNNLYVGVSGIIFGYTGGNPDTRRVVASGFKFFLIAIAVSPDGRDLYAVEAGGLVYRVDPKSGVITPMLNLDDIVNAVFLYSRGMTIFAPLYPGDLDWDGDVDLFDFAAFQQCSELDGRLPLTPACAPADTDNDHDVDFADFAGVQLGFGKPSSAN